MNPKLAVMSWLGFVLLAAAHWTPLQVGPWPGGAGDDVLGLRLGIAPVNRDVYGLSLGLGMDTIRGDGGGIHLALLTSAAGEYTGLSLALFNGDRVVHGIQGGGGEESRSWRSERE